MFKLILATGVAGLLLGCGGGDGGFDKIIKQGKVFKDKTCACTTQACLDGVEKEMEAWFEKAVGDFKGKPTKAQDEAWDKIEAEAEACEAKIKEAGRAAQGAAAIATMKGLKDKLCACADQACADKVQNELAESSKQYADYTPNEAETKEATALGEEMSKCMTKLATPPADPAAPAAPAAAPANPDAPPTPAAP